MNVGELRELANSYVDDSITTPYALRWFNECSDDLTAVARIRTRSTAGFLGGSEYALPNDVGELVSVSLDGEPMVDIAYAMANKGAKFYKRWGHVIVLADPVPEVQPADAYTLKTTYYRRLERFTEETDVPQIPAQFHRLYALWAGARYWKMWGDEPNKEAALMGEYLALKSEMDKRTRWDGGSPAFRSKMIW